MKIIIKKGGFSIMLNVDEFQAKYKTKEEKILALKNMSNEEIQCLIDTSTNILGKMFYKKHMK